MDKNAADETVAALKLVQDLPAFAVRSGVPLRTLQRLCKGDNAPSRAIRRDIDAALKKLMPKKSGA